MYSISLLSFIAVPVAYAVNSDPSALYIVSTLAICMSIVVVIGMILVPKVPTLPFVREKGLSWVLPLHETVETFLAGRSAAATKPNRSRASLTNGTNGVEHTEKNNE